MSSIDNFRKVPAKIPYKSGFDLSHRNTFTSTTGTLTPVYCQELMANSDHFVRIPFVLGMPPLAIDTFMNVNYKIEAFFVPTRLLMKSYDKWCTGETDIKYMVEGVATKKKVRTPVISIPYGDAKLGNGTLSDFLGFGSDLASGSANVIISAFPFLAYHLVYEEWYRNSLIQTSIFTDTVLPAYRADNFNSVVPSDYANVGFTLSLTSLFNDSVALGDLRQRNFGADYFSVATPSPQNGPAIGVGLTLNTSAFGAGLYNVLEAYGSGIVTDGADALDEFDGAVNNLEQSIADHQTRHWPADGGKKSGNLTVTSGITANQTPTSKLGGFTIASLRAANSLQQFLERNNIAGNRFVDFLRANYGANLADGVAQRPVYLGSRSIPVYVNGVLQTANGSDESGNNPFGSVASKYGNASCSDKDFVVKFHVDEPGYLLVLGSLVPEVTYSGGVARHLLRYVRPDSRTDMANHLLQNVGPQPIYESELVSATADSSYTTVFGYVDRYADWMCRNNEVHGLLKDGENLASFVLQRTFGGASLGSTFLKIPTNYLDQVMAVTDAESGYSYWMDAYIEHKASMPLARYSVPTLQDPAYEHGDTVWLNRAGVRIE